MEDGRLFAAARVSFKARLQRTRHISTAASRICFIAMIRWRWRFGER
jgi:hypothetical protein